MRLEIFSSFCFSGRRNGPGKTGGRTCRGRRPRLPTRQRGRTVSKRRSGRTPRQGCWRAKRHQANEGTLVSPKGGSQGAALAVGVCSPLATNPEHADLTIGGLDNTVCFTPFSRLKSVCLGTASMRRGRFSWLASRARCLKNREIPPPNSTGGTDGSSAGGCCLGFSFSG